MQLCKRAIKKVQMQVVTVYASVVHLKMWDSHKNIVLQPIMTKLKYYFNLVQQLFTLHSVFPPMFSQQYYCCVAHHQVPTQ